MDHALRNDRSPVQEDAPEPRPPPRQGRPARRGEEVRRPMTTKPYTLYKPSEERKTRSFDVIVVGAGMGGLACAAALSKLGKKVLVLEQHYTPGGFSQTFSRKGFTWDVGVHCLCEMGPRNVP